MKFLIVGDLHGNVPKIFYKEFDAIIAPGDFCSDEMKPWMFEEVRLHLADAKEKRRWYDLIGKRKALKMMRISIANGRKILEYLDSFGKPVYVVPGNWDWTADPGSPWEALRRDYYKELCKGLPNVVDCYHKRVRAGKYEIIGHGIWPGPEYPQYKQDLSRFTQAQLRKKRRAYEAEYAHVAGLFKRAKLPVILLTHNVPFNTKIDRIKNPASPRHGQHFGSLIARRAIDEFQPLVCVGGHMHEHFEAVRIKKTACINAGFGSKVNVLLELSGNRIESIEFHGKAQKY